MFVISGTNIKGEMVAPHPTLSTTIEEHMSFYFNTYSKDFLVQVNVCCVTAQTHNKYFKTYSYLLSF